MTPFRCECAHLPTRSPSGLASQEADANDRSREMATSAWVACVSSISEPATVRSAVDGGWHRQSVAGCFGDSIAVITAAHYGCFTLRPAIAETRTLVCELPELADSSGSPPSPKAAFGNARLFA